MTHPLPGIWTPLWSGRRLWLKFLPMTRDFLKNIFFKKSIYIFIKKSRVIYIFMHKYICCFSAATHLFNIIWRKFIWMLVHRWRQLRFLNAICHYAFCPCKNSTQRLIPTTQERRQSPSPNSVLWPIIKFRGHWSNGYAVGHLGARATCPAYNRRKNIFVKEFITCLIDWTRGHLQNLVNWPSLAKHCQVKKLC